MLSHIRKRRLIKPHHRPFILHHLAALIGAIALGAGLMVVTNIHSNAQVTPYKEVLDAHNYPPPPNGALSDLWGGYTKYAQTFTALNSGRLTRAQALLLTQNNPPPGTVVMQITALDETGYPGELLAEATIPGSELPQAGQSPYDQPMVSGEFETPAPVTAGHKYAVVIFNANPSQHSLLWAGDVFWSYLGDPYPEGMPLVEDNCSGYQGWENADLYFAVYVKSANSDQLTQTSSNATTDGSTYRGCYELD